MWYVADREEWRMSRFWESISIPILLVSLLVQTDAPFARQSDQTVLNHGVELTSILLAIIVIVIIMQTATALAFNKTNLIFMLTLCWAAKR